MAQFPPDARVAVCQITHRREGDEVTIGDPGRQVFLTIPAEGWEILSALSDGRTVGETAELYERAHGETPDLEDFLGLLADEGFVAPWGERAFDEPGTSSEPSRPMRVSPALARRLVSAPLLVVCAIVVAVAGVLVASDPHVVPGPRVLVFHHHLAAVLAALFVVTTIGVLLHELGHLLAARASGVPARIGIGHRLWIVVFETDMTGIWMEPKRRRYLAFLIGPIIDAVSAAALIGLLWAQRRGWVDFSPLLVQFTGAVLFSYFLRLLWQCFVFVRTDFYFVAATALNCKNLLGDTEDLLRNRLAGLRRRPPAVDQSAIPPAEMRAVRGYAVVWLGGRLLAFSSLFLVTGPVLWAYGVQLARAATGGHSTYGTVDLLTLGLLGLSTPIAGLSIWIRSLYQGRMQRRTDALA
jgi:putative peptide zinc metalloprotease protein